MDQGFDYWVSFDSDNPPYKNPLDLINLDLDIVGCPTPVWHFRGTEKEGSRPIYWNAYSYVEEEDAYREYQPQKGLQRVDAIGTGCFVIARRVFEHPEMRKGPFIRKTLPDGRVDKGNDISFCERATACGFDIWAHFDYQCMHFNEIELNEIIRAHEILFRGLIKKYQN
jgi:hypothetical protein